MLLADRVRLIAQGNYNRPAHHRPDLESKEEIFQHKMQAYDKVVFTNTAGEHGWGTRLGNTAGEHGWGTNQLGT